MIRKINEYAKRLINVIPKDFLNVYFFDLLSKLMGFIIMLFLIRNLSKEDYSNYTLFISLSSFVFGIFSSGLSLAYIRYTTENLSRNGSIQYKLYYLMLIIPAVAFTFVLLFQNLLSDLLNVDVMIVFLGLIFAFVLYVNRINQSHFQAQEKYKYGGTIEAVKNFLILAILPISVLYFKISIKKILVIYIISGIVSFVVSFIRIEKEKKSNVFIQTGSIRNIFQDTGWLIVYGIILNMFAQLDTFMISYFLEPKDVSNYGVAQKYYMLFLSLLPALQTVIRVRTSKKEVIDSREKQVNFSKKWMKKIWPISLIGVLILVGNSFWFLPLLNGSEYNNSILPFNILAIGLGISYLFAPNVSVLMSSKRYLSLCLFAFIALIISIIGNIILIPKIGIVGGAITTVVSQATLNILATIRILKK